MSFILQNWGRVSVSYNEDAPSEYSYKHPTDTLTEVLADDYFVEQKRSLSIDDLIIVKTVGGVNLLIITALIPALTSAVAMESVDENTDLILNSLELKNLNGAGHIVTSKTEIGHEPLLVDEPNFIIANGTMGIGTVNPVPGALVDFTSTDSFPVLPRMTTAERDAVSPVADASIMYNTTTGKFNGREGGTWKEFTLV